MNKISMVALSVLAVITNAQAGSLDAATAAKSATTAKYLAGCGFDYDCESSNNKIKNVPTTLKATGSANTVDLGGGSHTVEIIDKKNKALPSLKQKEMPKIEVSDKKNSYGTDNAEPKTKPTSAPKMSSGTQPTEQVKTKEGESIKNNPKTEGVRQKAVENKVQPKSEPKSVASKTNATSANQATTDTKPVKQDALSAPKQKAVLNSGKMPEDRMIGAREIIQNRESNIPYGVEKSKPLKEEAGRWTKPLTEDDWKEKPSKKVAEEETQDKQQKSDKPKTKKQEPKKQEKPEQKTVIKKFDPNRKIEFKPIYPPSETAQKIKKLDPNKKWGEFKKDPFASDKSLDGKYKSKTSSSGGSSRRGVANYGGDGDIALQKQAIANKQARIAREQAQADADAAFFAGALTDAMMGAAIHHIDAKNARKNGGSSGGSYEPTVYRSRGYADEKYSREEDSYSLPDPNKSGTYRKAKSMTGGGGW